jgi:hypothetical protein
MKNILLIDFDCKILPSIASSNNFKIAALVIGTEIEKKRIKDTYQIDSVFAVETIQEFYRNYNFQLNYDLISQHRHTQVKVENWFQRITSDVNMVQLLYSNSLHFWNQYFIENQIDAVISAGQEFGSNFDSVIFDIAVKYDKNVFILENELVDGQNTTAQVIFDYKNKRYLELNKSAMDLEDVDLLSYVHYTQSDKIINKNKNKNLSLKEILQKIPDQYGGFLVVMFFALIFGKYKSKINSFYISWWTYLENFLYTKKMLRYYKSLSIKFDKTEKYIFFALHMEPEATTLARTTFSNQLVIIKTLAQSLPKGWKLYVKEHPRQYKALNNFKRYYFLATINKFRSKEFYNEIISTKNVMLIDLDVNSKDIIKYAQAIVTINGSISLETIIQKKPLILFSQNSTSFQQLDEVFTINNLRDSTTALEKIAAGFLPKYEYLESFIKLHLYKFNIHTPHNYLNTIEYILKSPSK